MDLERKIVIFLRAIAALCGLSIIGLLFFQAVYSVLYQYILVLFFKVDKDPILLEILFLIIFGGFVVWLSYFKWLRISITIVIGLTSILLLYTRSQINTEGMDKYRYKHSKEVCVVIYQKNDDIYIGHHFVFLGTNVFYGTKRDSADYFILDKSELFLGISDSGEPMKVKMTNIVE